MFFDYVSEHITNFSRRAVDSATRLQVESVLCEVIPRSGSMESEFVEQHGDESKTSLSSLGQEVAESFAKAINACNEGSTTLAQQVDPSRLRIQQDRFHLWAVNLGLFSAGHGALQYRLRDDDFVSGYICTVFSELSGDLAAICDILYERRLPFEAESRASYSINNAAFAADVGEIHHDETASDFSDDTEELADDIDLEGLSELKYRSENILSKIDTIFNIVYKIRGPKKGSYRSNAELYSVTDTEDLEAHIEECKATSTAIVGFIFREELLQRQLKIEPTGAADLPAEHKDSSVSPESPEDPVTNAHVISPIDTFCKEQHWLITRLGRARARREQCFLYWNERAKTKSNQAAPDGPPQLDPLENRPGNGGSRNISHITNTRHTGQSTTTGTTLNPEAWNRAINQEEETLSNAGSISSDLISTRHVQLKEVHWPDAPTILAQGNFFVCPMCKTICPKGYLKDEKTWRAHLIHDLQSYMCTYPDCHEQDQLYDKRSEWAAHEALRHRRVWVCQSQPEIEFESRNDYLHHLDATHDHDSADLYLPRLITAAAQPSSKPRRPCPFCKAEFLYATEMQNHVAIHLERYSLLALPKLNEHGQIFEEEDKSSIAVPGGQGSRHGDFDWKEPILGDEQSAVAAAIKSDGQTLDSRTVEDIFTDLVSLSKMERSVRKAEAWVHQLPDNRLPSEHMRDEDLVSSLRVLGTLGVMITIIQTIGRSAINLQNPFHETATRLQTLQDALETCYNQLERIRYILPKDTAEVFERTLEKATEQAEVLRAIFNQTIKDSDSGRAHLFAVTVRRIGRVKSIEELIKGMCEAVKQLADYHAVKSARPDVSQTLDKMIEELDALEPPIPQESNPG